MFTGLSSPPTQWLLDLWGLLAAKPIYWSYAWAQVCDSWFSNDCFGKG